MPRLPVVVGSWGVDDPEADHGEETLGGSGSYVKIDAMAFFFFIFSPIPSNLIQLRP